MINLSYIIATRNRLSFLKITLENLVTGLQQDEEIVVVDGNSNDGSKEYLQELFATGKIHQFISEPDINQAHGWNKAMLLAKGILIKKIIDDDVFCYSAIRLCKNYMLANNDADVCISNDLSGDLRNYQYVSKLSRFNQFIAWKENKVPSFTFGDVHALIRRSSLAFIGLYNTGYIMMDWEYSLRISFLKSNIVYYTGYNALTVAHPNSVTSQRAIDLVNKQGLKGQFMYDYAGDSAEISLWSKIKIFIGKRLYKSKSTLQIEEAAATDIFTVYNYFYGFMEDLHRKETGKFY